MLGCCCCCCCSCWQDCGVGAMVYIATLPQFFFQWTALSRLRWRDRIGVSG